MCQWRVVISVVMELCQRSLDGKRMSNEWRTSVLVPFFKVNGDVRNCNAYKGIQLLEYAMEVVEKMLKKKDYKISDLK